MWDGQEQEEQIHVPMAVLAFLTVLGGALLVFGVIGMTRMNAELLLEAEKQREIQKANMNSLIGKKITAISGLDKPIIITTEGGGQVEVDCYKYAIDVKYSPAND